ncbi:MAG: hypothetical protein M3044_01290 [Thermoproteota archaeon]|nr:hypothetical protein [Thermoproteota archaeon]
MYGVDNVIDAELEFFANSKKTIDTYMNYTRPSLAVILEPIKKAFLDAKGRNVKLRYLTEITHDNIAACKEIMRIADELRHLDGIKGNFMVSETEYLAPVILFEKGKIAPQAVYSNLKEVVEQQRYIFDSFWMNAMDAEERIKEIEEGKVMRYETNVLKNQEEIDNKIKELLDHSNELLVCVRYGGLQLGYSRFLDLGKELMDKHRKGEHKGIRLVTTAVDRDSAELIKMLLDFGIQIIRVSMSLSCGLSAIRGQFCESLLIIALLSGLSRLPMLRHLVISTMDNEHQSAAAWTTECILQTIRRV